MERPVSQTISQDQYEYEQSGYIELDLSLSDNCGHVFLSRTMWWPCTVFDVTVRSVRQLKRHDQVEIYHKPDNSCSRLQAPEGLTGNL
jgi:hypothetical protein